MPGEKEGMVWKWVPPNDAALEHDDRGRQIIYSGHAIIKEYSDRGIVRGARYRGLEECNEQFCRACTHPFFYCNLKTKLMQCEACDMAKVMLHQKSIAVYVFRPDAPLYPCMIKVKKPVQEVPSADHKQVIRRLHAQYQNFNFQVQPYHNLAAYVGGAARAWNQPADPEDDA